MGLLAYSCLRILGEYILKTVKTMFHWLEFYFCKSLLMAYKISLVNIIDLFSMSYLKNIIT
jgi:hypothetical protein